MKFAAALLLCCLQGLALGQNWLSRTEKLYRYAGQDSLIVHQKEKTQDQQQLLMGRREYFYSTVPPKNALYREESSAWEAPILTNRTVVYQQNQPASSEKMEINYRRYHPKDDSCQVVWARKYDNKGELIKEDTFTYNKKSRLVKKCSYDYQGSTSLVCEHYKYSRKGRLKRFRSYSKWTTVNMLGRPANRQGLRIEYKYKYNRKGKLLGFKGKNYSSQIQQINRYDKKGQLSYSEYRTTRTYTPSKADRAKNDSLPKKIISVDKKVQTFENGKLSSELIVESNQERRKIQNTYRDSLLISSQILGKNQLKQEEKEFSYNPQGLLQQRITRRYSEKQQLLYTVLAQADEQGRIISEIQTVGDKTISTVLYQYDNQGNMTEQLLLNANGDKVERTQISYQYP